MRAPPGPTQALLPRICWPGFPRHLLPPKGSRLSEVCTGRSCASGPSLLCLTDWVCVVMVGVGGHSGMALGSQGLSLGWQGLGSPIN